MNRHGSWIARVAATAAIRKVVYILIASILAIAAGSFKASAQSYPCSSSKDVQSSDCRTKAQATAAASAAANEAVGEINASTEYGAAVCGVADDGTGAQIISRATYGTFSPGCGDGGTWYRTYVEAGPPDPDCSDAEPLTNKSATSFYTCSDGCRFEQANAGGVNVCLGEGSSMWCAANTWKPTGGSCEASDKPPMQFNPDQESCKSFGSGAYAECVKPNGDHCVTSAKGSVLCWSPGDTGPRSTSDGKEGGDRREAPETPKPPPNMKDPVETGTTNTTINNTTYNTSSYSGSGNMGGQGNTGTGGKDTGGTNDPKGQGDGNGNGNGNGQGDGDGDGDGEGGAGTGVGTLYTGTDKTVASVYGDFRASIEGAPIVGAASGFLGGCSGGGGSCPGEVWDGGEYAGQHDLSALCSGALGTILGYGGWVFLAGLGAAAFRIALL